MSSLATPGLCQDAVRPGDDGRGPHEFQGRGIGKRAARMLPEHARDDGRWGMVHAFPGVTTAPSNGICRSLGFTLAEEREIVFNNRVLRTNHWIIDPGTDLT
jgi:RimJ/RimL family protein N-acetyltransferase